MALEKKSNKKKAIDPSPVDVFVAQGGRIIGIDPGANTGIVGVFVDDSLSIEHGTWLGSVTVHPSASSKLQHPERDADMVRRIQKAVEELRPDIVIFEEPLDGSALWKGGRAMNSRDTAFRLGAYYACAVAACGGLGVPMFSYPVTNFKGRPGWMRGQRHDMIELRSKFWCTKLKNGPDHKSLTDHELMALGVLGYHLDALADAKKTERLLARKGIV